jgi:tRNA (guanine-N7-)-methyltransferase
MTDPQPRRALATTGRVASRLTLAEQNALRAQLAAAQPNISHPPANLEIELGMGNGLAMLARAQANPQGQFWGCEVYLNGLATAWRTLQRTPLPNAHLLAMDGRTLLAQQPPASVQRVLLPFPDPWPKARHHKRRLLQTELLDEIARVLVPGGTFWLITDWPDYAFHGLSLLYAHPQLQLAQTGEAAADCKPSARLAEPLGPQQLAQAPAWWVPTKYQAKAAVAGRVPWYICATRRP